MDDHEIYPYFARAGIVDSFFDQGRGDQSFARWVDRWIERSEHRAARRGYCLLDTFLSDSLPSPLLAEMMRASHRSNTKLRVLLAEPESHYAQARAESFGHGSAESFGHGRALTRAVRGLTIIASAVCDLLGIAMPNVAGASASDMPTQITEIASPHTFNLLLQFIEENASVAALELRHYERGVPSGPMFFLNDFLVYGHYCHGVSSRYLPWDIIVDDPETTNDRYDHLQDEFERLWDPTRRTRPHGERRSTSRQAISPQGPMHRYFLSYSWEDKVSADQMELGLIRKMRLVGRDEHSTRAGENLNNTIKAQIAESDTLVSLWSASYAQSDWATAELTYGMDLLKRRELTRVVLVSLDSTPIEDLRARTLLRLSGDDRQTLLESARVLAEQELPN